MAISAEHRSKFAALHQQWWRLQPSEKFSSGTNNSKQTNIKSPVISNGTTATITEDSTLTVIVTDATAISTKTATVSMNSTATIVVHNYRSIYLYWCSSTTIASYEKKNLCGQFKYTLFALFLTSSVTSIFSHSDQCAFIYFQNQLVV